MGVLPGRVATWLAMGDSGFSLWRAPDEQPDAPVPGRGPGHPGDPRVGRIKLHNLTNNLVLSVPAVICGADSFVVIANKRLAAAWDKNYLCQPIGLDSKPIWMQSPWGTRWALLQVR